MRLALRDAKTLYIFPTSVNRIAGSNIVDDHALALRLKNQLPAKNVSAVMTTRTAAWGMLGQMPSMMTCW